MPRRLLFSIFLIIVGSVRILSAKPASYRALIMPYEETFLEGNQELWDKSAELISTFYGLAPHYASWVLARSHGMTAAEQLEEIFPGQRLNSIILSEYGRFLEEKLPQLQTNSEALEFVTDAKKRGVKIFVYSTTDISLIQADILRRKLPVNFINPSSRPELSYPPLERVLGRNELPAEYVLVLGGSQYACNQAGVTGLDFALYHERVEARVDGERPCNITYKVNQLRDLKALLKPAGGGR